MILTIGSIGAGIGIVKLCIKYKSIKRTVEDYEMKWSDYVDFLKDDVIKERKMNWIYDYADKIKIRATERFVFYKKCKELGIRLTRMELSDEEALRKDDFIVDDVLKFYDREYDEFKFDLLGIYPKKYGYLLTAKYNNMPIEFNRLDIIDTKQKLEEIFKCKCKVSDEKDNKILIELYTKLPKKNLKLQSNSNNKVNSKFKIKEIFQHI
jgi:hypothetical protein